MTDRHHWNAQHLGYLALIAGTLFAQDKPRIASITGIPSEPIAPEKCTFSTSGYLEMENGKTLDFTDAEFGHMILPALRDGYVLTIYPPTKRGIFISQVCPNPSASKRP
jgi:hypothetical protein